MNKAREQYAGLYYRKGRIFVLPYHETTAGVLFGAAPVETLESNVSDQDLGEAVLRALMHSKHGVPHPVNWDTVPRPIYKAAGVKSWSELVRGALSCEIAGDGMKIKISPTRNSGSRSGFQFLKDLVVELPSTAAACEIGRAARIALERSE